jgi:hypothetical protein
MKREVVLCAAEEDTKASAIIRGERMMGDHMVGGCAVDGRGRRK